MDYLNIDEQRTHIVAWAKAVERRLLDIELSLSMNSSSEALLDEANRLRAGLAAAKQRLTALNVQP